MAPNDDDFEFFENRIQIYGSLATSAGRNQSFLGFQGHRGGGFWEVLKNQRKTLGERIRNLKTSEKGPPDKGGKKGSPSDREGKQGSSDGTGVTPPAPSPEGKGQSPSQPPPQPPPPPRSPQKIQQENFTRGVAVGTMTSMEEAQLRAKEEAAKQAGGGPRSESQTPPPPQQPTPPTPSPPPPSGGKLDPAKSKETLKDAKKDDKRDKRDKHDEHDDDEHHAHVPGQSAMEMASSGAAKAALKPKTTAVRPGSAMRSSAAARSGATGLKTTHAVRHVQAVRAAGITRIKTFVDEGKLAKDRKSLQSEPSPSEDESYDNETKQNKSKKGGRAEKPEDTSVAGELDEEELGSGDEFFEKSKNTDEEQEEEELFLEETHKNFDDDIGEDYDNSSIGTVECSNEMLGYDNHFSDPVDCSVIIVQSTSDRFNDPRSLDDEVQDVYREPETGDAENGVGLLSLYQCLWNLWISEHPFLRGFVTGFMSFGVILFCTTWMRKRKKHVEEFEDYNASTSARTDNVRQCCQTAWN